MRSRNFGEVYKKGFDFMSELYNRIEKLCKNEGFTITSMCKEANASRASLSDLNNGRKKNLSTDTLSKIGDTLGVSVGFFLGQEPKWEQAIEHFGFCWNQVRRENEKAESRAIVNDETKSIADRIDAQIIVFKALFSRSLMQNNFDMEHPDFNSYVAMILGQGPGKHSIPEELYDPLVYKYGTKEGIAAGTIYHKRNPPASVSTSRGNPVFDLLTDNEFLLVLDYAQRLINARPKQ